jgi:hypothetical protein
MSPKAWFTHPTRHDVSALASTLQNLFNRQRSSSLYHLGCFGLLELSRGLVSSTLAVARSPSSWKAMHLQEPWQQHSGSELLQLLQ